MADYSSLIGKSLFILHFTELWSWYTCYLCLKKIYDGTFSLVAQAIKNPLAMQKTWVQSLGQKDPLEKGMATHSSILA